MIRFGHLLFVVAFLATILGIRSANEQCMKHFNAVNKKCVLDYKQRVSWDSAKRLCESVGGQLPTANDFYHGVNFRGSWLAKSDKDQCHVSSYSTDNIKSCDSRFPVKCVHEPWHYRGKCPSGFFHVGSKCFKFLPPTYYKTLASTDLDKKCASIEGTKNGKVGRIVKDGYEHAALTLMLLPYDLILSVGSSSLWLMYGSQSLVPGHIVNVESQPSFSSLVCMSDMIITPGSDDAYKRYFGVWSKQDCPENYETFDSYPYCFKKFDEKMNRKSAASNCSEDGANLITIANEFDQSMASLLALELEGNEMFIGIENIDKGLVEWSDGSYSTYSKFETSPSSFVKCLSISDTGDWKSCSSGESGSFFCAKRRRKKTGKSKLVVEPCPGSKTAPCIIMGGTMYNITYSRSCEYPSITAQFKSRELAKILYDWARSPTTNLNKSTLMTYAMKVSRSANQVIYNSNNIPLNPDCIRKELKTCSLTKYVTICGSQHLTTTTVKPTADPKDSAGNGGPSNALIWILVGVIVFLLLLFGLVGGLCWYCNCRQRSTLSLTEEPEKPPKKSHSKPAHSETTSFSHPPIAPKPKLKPPLNSVNDDHHPIPMPDEDDEIGIFEEEYAELD